MVRLESVIQHYDWGSYDAIARLQGRPTPSARPEAELWLGAHPAAPSRLVHDGHERRVESGVDTESLAEVVVREPEAMLGKAVRERFGTFPFLLKILAAAQPLSIQAHPSKAQAEAGFAEEETRAVPRDAPHRNYKDSNHKPELLCALTRFEALCGFRAPSEAVALLDLLDVPDLAPARAALTRNGAPEGMREAFRAIMEPTGEGKAGILRSTLEACARHVASLGPFQPSLRWSLRLAELHPGDVGAVSALLLNHVVLDPGQAIYLAAGNLHAYLGGVGVEIMASSDNVLRGGLTSKYVDLSELLRVLDFSAGPVTPLVPVSVEGGHGEVRYQTPAPDFALSRIDLRDGDAFVAQLQGPEILLCIEGAATASSPAGAPISFVRGEALLAPAADLRYTLTGNGTVYRASVG